MITVSTDQDVKTLSIFPRDHYQRRKLFVEDSFQHQAKTNLNQLSWILNRFTMAGNVVLDPMGGIGSTFWGATMQRSVIVGEIEKHWLNILKRNCEQILKSWLFAYPMLAYQGDAMNLPFASGAISAVVTSPPYWDTFSDWHISSGALMRHRGPYGPAFGDDRGQDEKSNIGNIHIYEDYLRAIARVYREIHRVLVDMGPLVLILKDRIHKQSRVPIILDTIILCTALGFSLIERYNVPTRVSQFRTLYRRQNPNGPQITSEAIVVMRKRRLPGPVRRIAIVEGVGSRTESCTGQTVVSFFTNPVFHKTLAYSRAQTDNVLVLVAKQGLVSLERDVTDFDPELHRAKARVRREWIFDILRDQVMKGVFKTGDQITLCVSQRYARYLRRRLETLSCEVKEPLKGLNLGQQLAWLTERGF